MRAIFCFVILIVLAGCASREQIGAGQAGQQAALNHADKVRAVADHRDWPFFPPQTKPMMHCAERTVGHQVRLDMWLAALTLPTTGTPNRAE